jgi:hypothetical protein
LISIKDKKRKKQAQPTGIPVMQDNCADEYGIFFQQLVRFLH